MTGGQIELNGEDVLGDGRRTSERGPGIFMAFQRPMAIPGVKMADFLRHATTNVRNPDRKEGEELIPMREFRKELQGQDGAAADGRRVRPPLRQRRFLRRRNEAGRDPAAGDAAAEVRRSWTKPTAVWMPTPCGWPARVIAEIGREKMGLLIITHHDKLLEHNPPDFTHVMLGGRIVETGGVELADELHTHGYDRIRAAYPGGGSGESGDAGQGSSRGRWRNARSLIASHDFEANLQLTRQDRHMATDITSTTPSTQIGEINKYDFRTETNGVFKAARGSTRDRRPDLGDEERARLDA